MNYGELKTLIEGYLHRTDQTANIVTFITLAQARINHDLDVTEMVSRSQLTFSTRYITLPTDLRKVLDVQIEVDGGRRSLLPMSPTQLEVEYATTTEGSPVYFAHRGAEIEVQPVPGENTTMEILYLHRFAEFSLDADTNDILTNSPNVYIYATMLEASPFIQADERAPMWKEYYDAEVARLNEESEERKFSGGPLQIQKIGVSTP